MAHTITLKVGTIKGESAGVDSDTTKMLSTKPHALEIDCISWHWGVTQSAKASAGGGVSTADVHDLTVTKYVDFATPNLIADCHSAAKQKTGTKVGGAEVGAILTLFKNVDGKVLEFMTIKLMGDVIVSSVSTGEAGPNDMFTETVSFNFTKAMVTYKTPSGTENEKPINIA